MPPGDPTNPNNPQGPPSNQPIDPGVADVFARMASALDVANQKASQSEAALQKMAEHAKTVSEQADEASVKLKDMFKLSDSIEDNYKKIVEYGKKRASQSIKEFQDASKARKELEAIEKLHEGALKNAKDGTKEQKTMLRNLTDIRRAMKELPRDGQLATAQLQKIADIFEKTSANAKELTRSLSSFSRQSSVARSAIGLGSALGIPGAKNMHNRVERRMQKLDDIKDRTKELKEAQKGAVMKHMTAKRGKILDQFEKWGVDPNTDDARDVMARKMGFKSGSPKYKNFIAGEEAGGASAGGEAGAGWAASMSEGGGAIEGALSGLEGGLEALTAVAPEIIIPLEALAAVIEILIKVFDAYAKSNQEIEKNLGKGGIFSQPGVGAGEAFARARYALTPNVGRGVPLGVSLDRNMALAGAMTNSGYSPMGGAESGGDAANNAPGSMGEFMKGGLGEVQRIVMGAGRVGGLNDQEGIEQVMKLLTEYRETIASSEDFMAQLNKDTTAAGISTTKYLKIIDDVSGHFDKMGKSLEQVTGVMRELSRYGSISSESLKDMMEFLEAGQQQTNTGNMATSAFTQAIMPKETLESLRATEKATLQNYVGALNEQGQRAGVGPLDIQGAIQKGDYSGAQGMANQMRGGINNIQDSVVRQNMIDSLTKVQDQINRVAGVMSPDFLKRASSEGLNKEDSAQTIAKLFTNLRFSAASGGTSMKSLMEGGGSASQQILVQQLSEMLGVKQGGFANTFSLLRGEGANRVQDFATTPNATTRRQDARTLFNEIYKGAKTKEGIATYLTERGLGKYIKGGFDETIDNMSSTSGGVEDLKNLFNTNLDSIAESNGTQDKILKANSMGDKQSADVLSDQLSTARGISMRTQTVEDFLKNILQPMMLRLVSAIEFIATAVSKLPWFTGGNFANSQAKQSEDMGKIGPAIDSLSQNLEQRINALRDFQKTHIDATTGKMSTTDAATAADMSKQIQTGMSTFKKLEEIQARGTFANATEEKQAMQAAEQVGNGQVTINNFFSSSSTQDLADVPTAGSSRDKNPPNIKQAVPGRGLDNR